MGTSTPNPVIGDNGIADLTKRARGAKPFQAANGVPFWGDAPEAYDVVTLAGIRLPGIARVGGKVGQRCDRKRSAGVDGAELTHTGYEPAEIDITLKLWTPEHLSAYAKLVPKLKPRSTPPPPDKVTASFNGSPSNAVQDAINFAKSNPTFEEFNSSTPVIGFKVSHVEVARTVDIVHPWCTIFRIRAVQVLEMTFPEPIDDKGVYHCRVRCIEFVANGKTSVSTATASASIGSIAPNGGAIQNRIQQSRAAAAPSSTNLGP